MSDKGIEDSKGVQIFSEVIGAIIGYVIITRFMPNFSFVTENYAQWLPVGQFSIISTAILRAASKLSPHSLKHLLEAVALGISAYSTYAFVTLYPLDFASVGLAQLDSVVPLLLYLAVVGTIIGMLVSIFKALTPAEEIAKEPALKEA